MAKINPRVHCVDFNDPLEVKALLTFLRTNGAKISAWDQEKLNSNTFAIVTKHREKETKK